MGSASAFDHGALLYGSFPKEFLFGMGTASYQCEGGWDADGKGMNIWDRFVHERKEKIEDGSNGDVALDSYHHYKQDVQMLKAIGANVYRFSISWARIFPTGRTGKVNQPGVDFYNNLINELLANGIQPMPTLYHWDLPDALQQEFGGWLSEQIVEVFADYARFCFKTFGDRVKIWSTLNEPFISGMMGYYFATFAPGIEEPLEAPYRYVHNQLMSHAQAYRIYEKEFKAKQGGKVGISVDTSYYIPEDKNSEADKEACNRAFFFRLGWMLDPIFHGRYPKVMRDSIDSKSKEEGREKSRLPEFTPEWSEKLKGSADFIGINYYNAELVKCRYAGEPPAMWVGAFKIPFFSPHIPGWNSDNGVYRSHDPKWIRCGATWQDFAPGGIRGCLKWVSDTYGKPTLMVTETGCSGKDSRTDDDQRKEYFKLSLNAVLKSIKEDGCNVVGYVGWSLLDVYEWMSGYTIGFGIVQTDKSSPNMTRRLKDSAKYISTIFHKNGFVKGAEDQGTDEPKKGTCS